jgi:16S rRNA (uracil1498-N3)-methyltransferase
MKNIFWKDLITEDKVLKIENEQFHHFKNVIRGKSGEQVKIFNGNGLVAIGLVSDLGKKVMTIEIESIELKKEFNSTSLVVGIPKKEYLESILRSAIQIGVTQLHLVVTDFTPWKYSFYDRLYKIMESTLIQSENPYFPIIKEYLSLDQFLENLELETIVFSTEIQSEISLKGRKPEQLVIGPEGGFSSREVELFKNNNFITMIKLDQPIMKAEVAVPYGLGFLKSLSR